LEAFVRLNHLDLQVPDVQATALFFERHFAFEHRSNRASPAIAILQGADGFTLVLQRLKSAEERYPEGFHCGFLLEDRQAVIDFQARARSEALDVSDVIENGRGTLVYCKAPGGIVVEVSCRPPGR
jgi:catechol 2,3-dioxygenase-like lactoylglutathione lyase family enzyme